MKASPQHHPRRTKGRSYIQYTKQEVSYKGLSDEVLEYRSTTENQETGFPAIKILVTLRLNLVGASRRAHMTRLPV